MKLRCLIIRMYTDVKYYFLYDLSSQPGQHIQIQFETDVPHESNSGSAMFKLLRWLDKKGAVEVVVSFYENEEGVPYRAHHDASDAIPIKQFQEPEDL